METKKIIGSAVALAGASLLTITTMHVVKCVKNKNIKSYILAKISLNKAARDLKRKKITEEQFKTAQTIFEAAEENLTLKEKKYLGIDVSESEVIEPEFEVEVEVESEPEKE